MSLYDFEIAKELHDKDVPFIALIMAAMWKADSVNEYMFKFCWPGIWDELQKRYNAPGGKLEGE